ncbi:hypothetical protein PZ61_0235285 [Streptomyces sp. MNU77]|uniref:DnaB-like helicase C-terminal domain-containing protein n=1 Tax=Streptomyces sp. MNU77 TaxID=1573406 RepID=UPI00094BA447|nr:DnaB-like helicase C-terminal domain-containing protein [Streptomyces sp. MNU77]OLO35243.1 hypothetical protein PZ61_0235285 [Streptomyces sp. MNU77]
MLEAEARGLVEEQGVALLAVDGIQDIRPAKRSDLREREVGDVVRDLKALARELNMPVVATSPLNRNAEQALRPNLQSVFREDLPGGGGQRGPVITGGGFRPVVRRPSPVLPDVLRHPAAYRQGRRPVPAPGPVGRWGVCCAPSCCGRGFRGGAGEVIAGWC